MPVQRSKPAQSGGNPSPQGKGRDSKKPAIPADDRATYDLISSATLRDARLVGCGIDTRKPIDERFPHVMVLNMSFHEFPPKAVVEQVDPVLGRWLSGVTWEVDGKSFLVRHLPNAEGELKPTLLRKDGDGETVVETEDDGETLVIYRIRGNGERKQIAAVKVRALYCEVAWLVTTPLLVFEGGRIGEPGTERFHPIPGKPYNLVAVNDDFKVRNGDRWHWVQRSRVFPLDPSELSEDEYTAPPERDDEPMLKETVFYPVLRQLSKDEYETVPMSIDPHTGKRVYVARDERFQLLPEELGLPVKCRVREAKRSFQAFPDRREAIPESEVLKIKEFEEASTSAFARFDAEELDLKDDQFVHEGVKLSVYEALARFGVTPDSTRKEVDKARKKMELELHPDHNAVLKAYKAKGLNPPASLVEAMNKRPVFRTAFLRLLTVLTAREELDERVRKNLAEGNFDEFLEAKDGSDDKGTASA